MSLIPAHIPVNGDYDPTSLGTTIHYGDFVALANPMGDYLLLSGGPSVRTGVMEVGDDEIWQIVRSSGVISSDPVLLLGPNRAKNAQTRCNSALRWAWWHAHQYN